MDVAKWAPQVRPRVLRRDAEINRAAELTVAIAYRKLLDQSAVLGVVAASVQPQPLGKESKQ